ncbi:putative SGNH hydrolase-type esterase superfamily protein [Heracleum sosnowskyi]|uniref:SGNH hydrolase-type esterase superfamily protein n=1 Tax=Heracleum sosnowskyi TaxID=360622 RepID=A0AAD8MDJ5_9APIA|nr:putative SGNH hydrolase-type esterase superfamily protein [Heracleum sosnowskyi]
MPVSYSFIYRLLFFILFILGSSSETQTSNSTSNATNKLAIFVFGDSTVDPGNNNFIQTPFRSNFPPYGENFVNQIPTGRFSNGRLVTDFAASYAGVKENLPPYLDPSLSMDELMTGVSFASAGSGFDPLTARLDGVISIPEQMEHFREYKTKVETVIGTEKTEALLKKAVYVISAGTNDFVVNYYGASGIRRYSYSIPSYSEFLVQQMQLFIQELQDAGARKIVIVGVPPFGCLPIAITLYSNHILDHNRECITTMSSVAQDFNQIVTQRVKEMQRIDSKIYHVDIYKTLMDIIRDPKKSGFNKVDSGCCGTGLMEVSCLCNAESRLCSNVSEFVFFDSVHPTERTYFLLFKAIIPTIDLILQSN